jgi:hypothetical protein
MMLNIILDLTKHFMHACLTQHRMTIINYQLESMWKEVVVVYLKERVTVTYFITVTI